MLVVPSSCKNRDGFFIGQRDEYKNKEGDAMIRVPLCFKVQIESYSSSSSSASAALDAPRAILTDTTTAFLASEIDKPSFSKSFTRID